jgi:hypothetical protein
MEIALHRHSFYEREKSKTLGFIRLVDLVFFFLDALPFLSLFGLQPVPPLICSGQVRRLRFYSFSRAHAARDPVSAVSPDVRDLGAFPLQ